MGLKVLDCRMCPSCGRPDKDSEPARGGILLACADWYHKRPRERYFFEMQAESMFYSTLSAGDISRLSSIGQFSAYMRECIGEAV
jgi:hypothetical protein